jgi:hypothetical protein
MNAATETTDAQLLTIACRHAIAEMRHGSVRSDTLDPAVVNVLHDRRIAVERTDGLLELPVDAALTRRRSPPD